MHNLKFIRRRFPKHQERIITGAILLSGILLILGIILSFLF